jgi:hypothetical protein
MDAARAYWHALAVFVLPWIAAVGRALPSLAVRLVTVKMCAKLDPWPGCAVHWMTVSPFLGVLPRSQ